MRDDLKGKWKTRNNTEATLIAWDKVTCQWSGFYKVSEGYWKEEFWDKNGHHFSNTDLSNRDLDLMNKFPEGTDPPIRSRLN